MYKNMLACALKVDGKVLREFKDTVYIPFGSEYSILLKNMNSVKCLVTIEIDGRDIGDGSKFIVNPKDTFEIERFITNGNLSAGNKFKFIERTSKIEEHRGIQVEDGLVTISYQFEQPIALTNSFLNTNLYSQHSIPKGINRSLSSDFMITCSTNTGGNATLDSLMSDKSIGSVNDVGITVEGAVSTQQFSNGYIGRLDPAVSVMVIKLLGGDGEKAVTEAVTVKRKTICKTCGTKNSSKVKFCGECGTALDII